MHSPEPARATNLAPTAPLLSLPALLLLSVPTAAQHGHGHGEEEMHYVREPIVVDDASVSVEQVAVDSDAELSVVLYREGGGSNQVRSVVSDGRGLSWSAASALVSGASGDARSIQRDSIHVVGDEAYAVWADDAAGSGATRLYFNLYSQSTGSWGSPTPINATGISGDVTAWHVVAKPGLVSGFPGFGNAVVAVIYKVRNAGDTADTLHLSVYNGLSWLAPVAVSVNGVSPGGVSEVDIAGVGIDTQLGELYVAWADDRAGSQGLYFRRGLVSWLGTVLWIGPDKDEIVVNSGEVALGDAGADVLGDPIVAVNDSFVWTGEDARYVGIVWAQDDGDGTATLHARASHDQGTSFLPDPSGASSILGHTGDPGVDVGSFDFDIMATKFTAVWDDDANIGTVGQQVYRAESLDGVDWTGVDPRSSFVFNMSADADPDTPGRDPMLMRTVATPDGAGLSFLQEVEGDPCLAGPDGFEVFTAFADQAFGSEWHLADYPVPSEAQGDAAFEREVRNGDICSNDLYYNFINVWLEEVGPGGAVTPELHVVVGGYRPQVVEIEGWHDHDGGGPVIGEFGFATDHLPFDDSFFWVFASLSTPESVPVLFPQLTLPLPDGRVTGLIQDPFMNLTFGSLFGFFLAENDVAAEGGVTTPVPVLSNLTQGTEIAFVAASWGAQGEFRALTDVFFEEWGCGNDLEIAGATSDPAPSVTDVVTLTFTVTNNGPDDDDDVEVGVTLPEGVAYLSDDSGLTGTDYCAATGGWEIGFLPASASIALEVDVQVNGCGILIAEGAVEGECGDADEDNDEADVELTVVDDVSGNLEADLSISKLVSSATPAEGDVVLVTLTASNLGPCDVADAEVEYALPAGLTYLIDDSFGDYDADAGEWEVGELADGESATLVIKAEVAAGTSGQMISNTAEVKIADDLVTAGLTDPNSANDTASGVRLTVQ